MTFFFPSDSARVMFDSSISMREQVNKLWLLEIRRIGSIRKYLTTDATKMLVTFLVNSRLDYCNSLLAGIP